MLTTLLLATLAFAGGPTMRRPPPGNYARSVRVGGLDRHYLLHVPPRLRAHAAPLVLMLHPSGGSGRRLAASTAFDSEANRRGFLVIYPEAVNGHWNDGRDSASADDVAFMRVLLDSVAPRLQADSRRVFAAGISNGAFFAQRIACDLPGRLAAVASVAGGMPAAAAARCTDAPPTSFIAFNGTADQLVPYIGSAGGFLSATESAGHWAARAHCGEPVRTLEPDRAPRDGTRVRRAGWTHCDAGTRVVLYTIEGGGHSWPGAGQMRVARLGRTSQDLSATRVIGAFFQATRPS